MGIGARGRAGACLTSSGGGFTGIGQRLGCDPDSVLAIALRVSGPGDFGFAGGGVALDSLDIGGMAGGLIGQLLLLIFHRHRAGGCFRQPLLGLQ